MALRIRRNKKGYDQLLLRLAALAAMALYVSGALKGFSPLVHDGVGRFSFTVFAWMLAEGYEKSGDRYVYARRLLLFALLAEVPYDLLNFGYYVSSRGQNSLFTLLAALCSFWIIDVLKEKADNSVLSIIIDLAVFAAAVTVAGITSMEGGMMGMICAFAFHISFSLSYPKLFQTAVILPCAAVFCPGEALFIAAAVLLCWGYNGSRGSNALALRYLFYAAYPLTLLICWLVKN
ncbi:MAG: hypothetical protein II971_05295 [Firmicutes bacterium]|nr:hypothetical protein [Bacillota bacterium]